MSVCLSVCRSVGSVGRSVCLSLSVYLSMHLSIYTLSIIICRFAVFDCGHCGLHLRVSHSCVAPCSTNSGFFAPGLQSCYQDRLNDRGAQAAAVYQQVWIERVQCVEPNSKWFLFLPGPGRNKRSGEQTALVVRQKEHVKSTVARKEHYMRMAGLST